MRSIRWVWLSTSLLSAAFALAACGDDDDTGATPTTSAGATTGAQGGAGQGGAAAHGGMSQGGAGQGGAATVHGCSRAGADDHTGQVQVVLSWGDPHSECLVVDTGTEVVWQGDFTMHPLAGGVSPTPAPSSPISQAAPSGGSSSVTFSTAGDYPYFCEIHVSSMQGVIYVE